MFGNKKNLCKISLYKKPMKIPQMINVWLNKSLSCSFSSFPFPHTKTSRKTCTIVHAFCLIVLLQLLIPHIFWVNFIQKYLGGILTFKFWYCFLRIKISSQIFFPFSTYSWSHEEGENLCAFKCEGRTREEESLIWIIR